MRLKELMEMRGLSQKDVAHDLEMSPQTVNNYVNGRREPDFGTLIRFADYFGVTVDYLIGREPKSEETRPFEFGVIKNAGRSMKLDMDEEITLEVNGSIVRISVEKV